MNKPLKIAISRHPLDRRWVFESISYNGKKPEPIDDSDGALPRNATPGLNAIGLLTLATLLDRSAPEKGRYSNRIIDKISPLLHSRRTGWIKEVFGPKGFQEALKVVTRKGVKTTEFKDHINLEPYIVGEREAYDPQAFAEVIHQFTKEEPKPTKADFEIRIITPDDIFSSLDRKGQLNEGDSLILEIHCLKTKHLFVCWLTCKGKTPVELYPVFSIDSENPNSGHLFNKQQKIITIPEQGCSEVDEGPGVETCLVAMRETPYKIDDRTKIINTVTKALKIRKVSFPPLKMTMSCLEPHRITEHAMSGLRTPSIGDKWEKQLAIELRELADKIYFLKVPNRG